MDRDFERKVRERAEKIARIAYPRVDGPNPSIALTAMCHAIATFIDVLQSQFPHRNVLDETIRIIRMNVASNPPPH